MSALVSHKYKFIFPHVPRTAGTSLTEFVMPYLTDTDRTHSNQFEKHQALRTLKLALRRGDLFDKYVKFAVVRHPFDRIASLNVGYDGGKCDMNRLIERMVSGRVNIDKFAFFWSQQRWLCDHKGDMLAGKIFKFEDGFELVIDFLIDLGIPVDADNFPKLNAAKKEAYTVDDVTPENLEAFYKLYQWDYDELGYK